ncbi:MAG TPA: monovalent cation/H(+) antiporter subunit G [Streptosporangiaceae bacterium]|nr:monovalent cation/H(+) antiporter subunit G [Streptosporangiaceae bacterium]
MTGRDIVADVALGIAVAIVLASSVGVLVMRDPGQKVHYVTPAALVAPLFVGLAILAQSGLTDNTAEMCLALIFLGVAGPFLSHATMRAIRIRETGGWRPWADERHAGRRS